MRRHRRRAGIGAAGALVLTRLLGSLLFAIEPTDPGIFGVVTLAVVAVSLLASYLPARRAARVDPVAVLNRE